MIDPFTGKEIIVLGAHLKRVIAENNTGSQELIRYAERMYRVNLASVRGPEAVVGSAVNVVVAILKASVDAEGRMKPAVAMIVNEICSTMLMFVAAESEVTLQTYEECRELTDDLKKKPNQLILAGLAMELLGHLRARLQIENIAQSVKFADAHEIEFEVPDLLASRTELMSAIATLRKYGVKSVITPGEKVLREDTSWVIDDIYPWMQEFYSTKSPAFHTHRTLASVSLGTTTSLKDHHVVTSRIKKGDVVLMKHVGGQHNSLLCMFQNAVGDFSFVPFTDCAPTKHFFARCGLPGTYLYEYLAFRHAMHLFDLTVPMSTHARYANEERQLFEHGDGSAREPPSIRTLIVPRLRAVQQIIEVQREMEREMEEALHETVRRSKIARHSVEWFVRNLPAGHRPSPSARKRAMEIAGITLGKNETFVKPFKRGEGEEIGAHHMKSR